MSISLRACVGALVACVGVAFAGCSSGPDLVTPGEDGGVTPEGGELDSAIDTGPPPPPCSRLTTLCKDGEKCEGAADCESNLCREGVCKPISPADGQKNGDETDVDCGGSAAPACADGKGCAVAPDCTSGVCTGAICQAPTATDGVKNGDETGKDCGGTTTKAPKCPTGEGCLTDDDCNKVRCDTVQKKCKAPTNDDGIKNLDETGVDCGGPTATVARCATGQGCVATSDCANVLCNADTLVCDPPTATDNLKNGTETDIDCGGGAPTNAPKCLVNKTCTVDADCQSSGCSAALGNRCSPVSCATAEVAGINSCGAIETGQPGAAAAHESCCKSLVLPTRNTRRLDKYEITSGRFRTFLGKVGPNVRAWVQAYAAANPDSQLAKFATTSITDGTDNSASTLAAIFPSVASGAHGVVQHMASDIDNYDGIRGCYNGPTNYSANTYWMTNAEYAQLGLPPRSLARSFSDEKPLNCAMPIMMMAFCAWDGGELATIADYRDAWTATYPWGNNVQTRPDFNWCNGTYNNGGFNCQCDGVAGRPWQSYVNHRACPAAGFQGLSGAGVFYEWPRNTDRAKDNEPLIAAPGRITGDASALKGDGESWMDLYANLAEYTGDYTASTNDWCDHSTNGAAAANSCKRNGHANFGVRYTGIPRVGIIGQTWEGHEYNKGGTNSFQATFQYGKFGGRCVRPAAPY